VINPSPQDLEFEVVEEPSGIGAGSSSRLRAWIATSAKAQRVALLVDNQEVGFWGLGVFLGEVAGRRASDLGGVDIALPMEHLSKIGPGRVSLRLETEENAQVVWRWEKGFASEEEPEEILKFRRWVSQHCDYDSSEEGPSDRRPELHLLFAYDGDLDEVQISCLSAGDRSLKPTSRSTFWDLS